MPRGSVSPNKILKFGLADMRNVRYKIIARLRGVTRETFAEDDEKQDGVIRQLEIVGEAASGVSADFRAAHLSLRRSTCLKM